MSESAGPEPGGNDSREWLNAVVRGGRWLVLAPAVWFVATPLAVFWHDPVVVAVALFQLLGTWSLTWRARAPTDPALGRLAWSLRGIALSGVPMVYASSLGYRALLLAELAVRCLYLSRLAPRLAKPTWGKYFLWSAGGCAVSALFVGGDLAWRVFSHSLVLDPWSSRLVALSALPFMTGGWLLLAELVAERSELGAWWEYGFGAVVNLGFASALVFGSVVAGFVISYCGAEGEPGVMRGSISLCLLASTGAFLAAHLVITRKQAGLRRAIAVFAMVQAPIIWVLLFRPEFSSERWKRFARENGACDGSMAEDLVYSLTVRGKTRAQVEQLLGPPITRLDLTSPAQAEEPKATASRFVYRFKDGEPCLGLSLMFEKGVVADTQLFMCDD